jgi:hypothetical protein
LRPIDRKSSRPSAIARSATSGSTRPDAMTGTPTAALILAAKGRFSPGSCGVCEAVCRLLLALEW